MKGGSKSWEECDYLDPLIELALFFGTYPWLLHTWLQLFISFENHGQLTNHDYLDSDKNKPIIWPYLKVKTKFLYKNVFFFYL